MYNERIDHLLADLHKITQIMKVWKKNLGLRRYTGGGLLDNGIAAVQYQSRTNETNTDRKKKGKRPWIFF